MPKKYALKDPAELLRMKEMQDAEEDRAVDWDLEEAKEQLREFFQKPIDRTAGPGD